MAETTGDELMTVTQHADGSWDLYEDRSDPDYMSPILSVTDGTTLREHGLMRIGPWLDDPIEPGAVSAFVERAQE